MTLKDFGRQTDPALLILASLAGGPKHGYAIMCDVEALAGVRLGPGTLYGSLSRLEEGGHIKAKVSTDRRRPYRLTTKGARLLREKLAILQEIVRVGQKRLMTSSGEVG